MHNVWVLLKANILQSLGLNKLLNIRTKSEKGRIALVTSILIVGLLFTFMMSFLYMFGLATLLKSIGAFQYFLSFAVILAWISIFCVCLYMMPGYLLAFKDFHLLWALPLNSTAILLSKMLFLYLLNYLITLLITIPIVVIYGTETNANLLFYLFALITTIFIPLIPMEIGAFVSFLLGKLSTKFRSQNTVLLIGSFILLLAFFAGPLFIGGNTTTQVTALLPVIEKTVNLLFLPAVFMQGLRDLHVGDLLLFAGINVVPFVLLTAVFSKGFMSINAQMTETYKAETFQLTSLKTSSIFNALVRKELRTYFSSYIYVLNTSFGMVLLTFFVIMTTFLGSDMLKQFIGISTNYPMELPIFMAIFTASVCLSCTTACSISIEGQTYWIAKSLPLDPWSIFKSKITVNLIVIMPLLVIDTGIVAVTYHVSFISSILLLVVPSLYALLIASVGLLINLYVPKLIWSSPMIVVKQSSSVLLSMLFGFLVAVLSFGCFMIFQPQNFLAFSCGLILFLLAVNAIVWRVLKTKGVHLYQQL
ncbi:hypothetical protein [Ectobacillus polymachus]|uniref:hypothetical protein n=1 Tax=Ectobacillus polymachus TaxID=1508806 RepID=UPI003A85EE97